MPLRCILGQHYYSVKRVRMGTDYQIRDSTAELHLTGLTGTTSHPHMQETRIIGFLYENRLYWQYEVEINIYKRLF